MEALLSPGPTWSPLHDDLCTQRKVALHRAMRIGLDNLIYSRDCLVGLGPDPLLDQLMRAAGFRQLDYVATRFAACGASATVVVLAQRVWKDPDGRAQAIEVKRSARAERTRCILIPSSAVQSTVRAVVARTIARGRRVVFGREEEEAVLAHVREARISTVRGAAQSVEDHPDPFGVILSMIARGQLDIDRSRALSAESWLTTVI